MAYKYPNDPATRPNQSTQEPRSLVIPNEKPGQAQSVGLAVADIPSRLIGGDGIRVEAKGFAYAVSLDIEELAVAQGQPNQQWLAVWIEGSGSDEIRRVPVNAIPADANHDNIVYGRQNGAWVPAISSVTIDWDDVTNKPVTFPPELPIPSSGVTGLDAKQNQQDGRLTTNEGNIAANAAAITAIDNDLSAVETGKVAKAGDTMSGPLTLPGAPVNALHAATKAYADGKVAKAGDTMTGSLKIEMASPFITLQPAVAGQSRLIVSGENTSKRWLIALGDGNTETGANAGSDFRLERFDDSGNGIDYPFAVNRATGVASFTKTPLVAGSPLIGGATISDTPPVAPVPGQFWWESDSGGLFLRYADANSSQWVQVNSPSLPDAVRDGKAYGRLDGTWTQVLPITGGTLTGNLSVNGAISSSITVSVGSVLLFPNVAGFQIGYGPGANFTATGGTFKFMISGNDMLQIGPSGVWPLGSYADNTLYLGKNGNRWYQVWAGLATIQTSDENDKRDIRALDEMEREAAQAMKGLIRAYRWKPETIPDHDQPAAEKINIGVIAQQVEQCLRDAGLDPDLYSMWRKDEIVIMHEEVRDEEGNVVEEGREEPTGEYRYSVDYNQILAFVIGGL